MTQKRFIHDVSEILDTWFGYMGKDEPTEREIREKDYLLIGVARSQRDAENICEKLNEQNEELIEYCNFSLHDLLDKKNKEIEQLTQAIDNMGGRLQGLWANYYENRWGVWSEAVEDVAKELGFKIYKPCDAPISNSDSKKERINGVKKVNEVMCENEQLKSEKQAIINILDEMENGDCFWDRDYLIDRISDIEIAIGVDLDD